MIVIVSAMITFVHANIVKKPAMIVLIPAIIASRYANIVKITCNDNKKPAMKVF